MYPEQSKHAHSHRCWHWYDSSDHAGGGEMRSVVSLVNALIEKYAFDGQRIYVAGMSAGAGLASLLAVHYPERFAAVGLPFGTGHSAKRIPASPPWTSCAGARAMILRH